MIRDGKGSDEVFIESSLMKSMGWSWADLCNTPERVYLSINRIMVIKAQHEKAEREKAKEKRTKGMGGK